MKFFRKRSAMAMLLAAVMMSTNVVPVFAEGSKEMSTVPTDGTQPVEGKTDAMRPYLEWRDRDQFGMPSKNVVNVYAKKGETIFFGSDVTNASDRSIQAIVHEESMYSSGGNIADSLTLDDNSTLKGASIAVTLPESDGGEAFNPEKEKAYFFTTTTDADGKEIDTPTNTTVRSYVESNFLPGSSLTTGADRKKVYLFDVVENGAGHIANPTMEQNGPNMDGTNPNGYAPLSFVAPYTGTYAFRFLSREYTNSDLPIVPTMVPEVREYLGAIDFDGYGELGVEKLDVSGDTEIKETRSYYEPNFGWVTVNGYDVASGTDRGYHIKEETSSITIPATDYADKVDSYIPNRYFQPSTTSTSTGGSITFTPLHDDVEIEIVWERVSADDDSRRTIYVKQGDSADDDSRKNYGTGVQVTTINSVNNESIKANVPLTIWISENYGNTKIYEIRYYYNRAEAPLVDVSPQPTESPKPIVYEPESLDLSPLEGKAAQEPYTITDDDYTVTFTGGTTTKENGDIVNRGFTYVPCDATTPIAGGKTYTSYITQNGNNSAECGAIVLTSQHNDSWFEIIMTANGDGTTNVNETIGTTTTKIAAITKGTSASFRTSELNAGTTATIVFEKQHTYIYEIIYHVEDVWPYDSRDESVDYTEISEEYSGKDNYTYSGTITDELYDMTFYSAFQDEAKTNDRGFQYREISAVSVGTKTYTESLYQNVGNYKDFFHMSDGEPTDKTAGIIAVTPKHENAWLEIVVKNGNTSNAVSLVSYNNDVAASGSVTVGSTGTLTTGSIPVGKTAYFYFSQQWTDILEIIYHFEGTTETAQSLEVSSLLADTTVSTDATPKPVSNKYIWDFYYMTGEGDYNADKGYPEYTSDCLVGSYNNSPDHDSSYVYDLKVHATDTKQVPINNKSVWLMNAPEWNESDGTPISGVLELVPYYSGKISVSYGDSGYPIIKQGDNIAAGNAAAWGEVKGVSLTVTAGQPVYIYQGASVYVKSVKYTPDDSGDLQRKIDEKWATTGALVAAWDVTVAQGGGQTIEGDTYVWHPGECLSRDNETYISTDGKFKIFLGGGLSAGDPNNFGYTFLKLNSLKNNGASNYISYIPDVSGTIKVTAYSGEQTNDLGNKVIYITQNDNTVGQGTKTAYNLETIEAKVSAGAEVKIYSSLDGGTVENYTGNYANETTSAFFYEIEFTEDSKTLTGYEAVPGRAWTDIFFLNAGNYGSSIYPQLHVLTKNGFLYDFRMNGVQPYGFVFYSNNRGFLLDRWSLYSNPNLSGTDIVDETNRTGTKAGLQSLEHSFYSYTSGFDVGPAPIRTEKEADGDDVEWNNNTMVSPILGNYIPTDDEKDATHMMFFNTPDQASFENYTTSKGLRVISSNSTLYSEILKNIEYVGLGRAAYGNYGTEGIGGEFHVKITADMAAKLKSLGSNSIAVILNFSAYDLVYEGTAPVPVLTDGAWAKIADTNASNLEGEANNLVSLSMVVDTEKAGEYTLSWDGRDAYGNIVPVGTYSDIITSVIEMGTAHFPILDAEHNPNGFKVKMMNPGNELADHLYYNNEAVSPKTNASDPSAWYFTGRDIVNRYPARIGDGKNYTAGVSTGAGSTSNGAMVFGDYSSELEGETLSEVYKGLSKGQTGGDGGYGNYAAIDMWSRYKIDTESTMTIGVANVTDLEPYVSFVAMNGTTELAEYPFKKSHVGFAGKVVAEYKGENTGVVDTAANAEEDGTQKQYSMGKGIDNIYGHTISTGFVTEVSSVSDVSNDYIAWKITIPVSAKKTIDGTETTMPTYIKIPTDSKELESFTTAEQLEEQEYLAYEMYSALFEDYAMEGEDGVGDEYVPDWEADASLDEDGDVDIMDTPTGAEGAADALSEESYIESITMLSETEATGEYTNDSKWGLKMVVNSTAVLSDEESKVNKGNIYQLTAMGDDNTSSADASAQIVVQYKLPTVVTGTGKVQTGIIIDNLYAPGASAYALFNTEALDGYHDITKLLTGTSNSVQATSWEKYYTHDNNEYFDYKSNLTAIDYEMDFRTSNSAVENEVSATIGGAVITNTQANYSLFDGNVGLNNFRYNNNHGIDVGSSIAVAVPGPVEITIGTCAYDDVKIVLKNAAGETIAEHDNVVGSKQDLTAGGKGTYNCYGDSNGSVSFTYTGVPTTLTISFENSTNGIYDGARFWIPYLRIKSTTN